MRRFFGLGPPTENTHRRSHSRDRYGDPGRRGRSIERTTSRQPKGYETRDIGGGGIYTGALDSLEIIAAMLNFPL
jgi:hypothetical protein